MLEEYGPIGYKATSIILKPNWAVGKKRIYRIMREERLLCKKARKYRVKTTNSDHKLPKYQNLIKDVKYTAVGQAIVGDVTQFSIQGKDAFLALLTDLYNREIVGYAVARRNDTNLVATALGRALATRGDLSNCIHHTDADVRYCSHAYTNILKAAGMQISMVCGNVYENAHAESVNKTLKYKLINLTDFETLAEADMAIRRYIEFYNYLKPHTSLGWLTPIAYAAKNRGTEKLQKMIPILRG